MSYTLRPHRGSDLASTFLSCFFFICFTILISFDRHTHLKQVHQSLRRHLFPFLITVFFIKLDSTTKSELEAATRYDQTPASSQ